MIDTDDIQLADPTPPAIDAMLSRHRHELHDALQGIRDRHAGMVRAVREGIRENATQAVAEVEAQVQRQLRRDIARDEPVVYPVFGSLPASVRKALAQAEIAAATGDRGFVVLIPRQATGGNERERKAFLVCDVSDQIWKS